MKKIFPIIFILCLVLATTFSCKMNAEKGVYFDTATFNAMKEKWKSFDLEEYSFKYSFNDWYPNCIMGDVAVDKNHKTVRVVCDEIINQDDGSIIQEGEIVTKDSKYYFETMEGIFDGLYAEYEAALHIVDSGDYEYIEIFCKYDEEYGYPKEIVARGKGGSKDLSKLGLRGTSNSYYNFKMRNFATEK